MEEINAEYIANLRDPNSKEREALRIIRESNFIERLLAGEFDEPKQTIQERLGLPWRVGRLENRSGYWIKDSGDRCFAQFDEDEVLFAQVIIFVMNRIVDGLLDGDGHLREFRGLDGLPLPPNEIADRVCYECGRIGSRIKELIDGQG